MKLENDQLRVVIDEKDGSMISLYNKELGREVIGAPEKAENFRLSVPLPEDWTYTVFGKDMPAAVTGCDDGTVEIAWDRITVCGKESGICLKATLSLSGDELEARMEIVNNSDYKIDYVWYPVIGGVERLSEKYTDDLYKPHFCGMIDRDIYGNDWVEESNRYWYTAREFKSAVYPQSSHMQFSLLANPESGLYLSSKDHTDFYSGFYYEHERKNTPMTISIVKAPFLEPQESYHSCKNVVSFYRGSWHTAAGKYKKWLNTWFQRKKRPEWVENLDGWLAFQGHCGDMHIAHPFAEYPTWLEKARSAGLNTIHVHCGVHEEGIEGGYPYWTNVSSRMGGREELTRVLDDIHAKGGRVITFTKDNKVNQGIEGFHEKFRKYAVRLRDGANPRVSYSVGTLDLLQSGAQLAVMCRANREWQDFITKQMEGIASMGFDGNMIDEWCSGMDLCMAKDHGHRKPTAVFSGQHELGKRISEVSLKQNPEFLLAGEEIWDAAYEYMDLSFARGGCAQWWGRDPRFYEIFAYTIPGIQCTAEILENEYLHLNYAFACGYMLVLCIDYYHSGPDAYPEFAAYFKEVIRIRGAVRRYFTKGEFRDDLDYFVISAGQVKAKSHRLGQNDLIVLYNEGEEAEVSLPLGNAVEKVIVYTPFEENEIISGVESVNRILPGKSMLAVEVIRKDGK
ncbi:MAG: DUF6259 domain-containing protein [Fusicatenibacter sp.]|nr:DUF6259 domain-containing protein [Fusicatenibacter sp.]